MKSDRRSVRHAVSSTIWWHPTIAARQVGGQGVYPDASHTPVRFSYTCAPFVHLRLCCLPKLQHVGGSRWCTLMGELLCNRILNV